MSPRGRHAVVASVVRLLAAAALGAVFSSDWRAGIIAEAGAHGGAQWASPVWHFLGPFPVGKTEIDGDPLFAPPYRDLIRDPSGTFADSRSSGNSPLHGEFSDIVSETVTGGTLPTWTPLRSQGMGAHQQVGPDTYAAQVDLNGLIQKSSSITIQEFQGYVRRSFKVAKSAAGLTFSLSCSGLHTITVDGTPYQSDVYSSGRIFVVMPRLSEGIHWVVSRIRGKGYASFRCKLQGPHKNGHLAVFAPPQDERPDIMHGNIVTPFLSLSISNMGGEPIEIKDSSLSAKIISVAGKRVQDDSVWSSPSAVSVKLAPSAAAITSSGSLNVQVSQTLAVPVYVAFSSGILDGIIDNSEEMNECVVLNIRVKGSPRQDSLEHLDIAQTKLSFRCRHKKQSHILTYISHDGTVASAAVILPRKKSCSEPHGCPIVLALSGVGVKPSSMADSFKYKRRGRDKDFTFGLNGAWILAPERDGAHNMEGTGHLTMLSAVRALSDLMTPPLDAPSHQSHYRYSVVGDARGVDATRLVYTGHSRGGHGALLFGTHLPDLSCGVFASNGWIRREYYADANPIFDHDLQLSHTGPETIRKVFESSIAENDVGLSAANMIGLPTLLRTSAFDGTVSPFFTRRMARHLMGLEQSMQHTHNASSKTLSTSVVLDEFTSDRSKGHWWWNSRKTNDGGVMFDAKVRKFLSAVLHSCRHKAEQDDGNGSTVASYFESVSLNPGSFHGNYGIRIIQFAVPFRYARVRVERANKGDSGGYKWVFRTHNAIRFEVKPTSRTHWQYVLPSRLDGTDFPNEQLEEALHSVKTSTAGSDDSVPITFAKDLKTGVWRIDSPLDDHHAINGRGVLTSGPMRQVFDRSTVIVVDTKDESALSLAVLLANSHYTASRTSISIVSETSIGDDYDNLNFVFIGRSRLGETIVNDLAPKDFPFRLGQGNNATGFSFNGRVFKNSATAFIVPRKSSSNRYDRLALVLAENNDGGNGSPLRDLMTSHTYSSNTPLTRAMFTNMFPDYVITDGDTFLWKGLGGLHAAGYFSHIDWSADPTMSVGI